MALDTRILEYFLGPAIGRQRHLVNRCEIGAGNIQVDAAGAPVVAADDRAPGREGAHARVLPVLAGDRIHQRFDIRRTYRLGDNADLVSADPQGHVQDCRHIGLSPVKQGGICIHVGQQPGFYLGADFFHRRQVVPRGRVHGGKYFWFLPLGQVFRRRCHQPDHRQAEQGGDRDTGEAPGGGRNGAVNKFEGGVAAAVEHRLVGRVAVAAAEVEPGSRRRQHGHRHQHGGQDGGGNGDRHVGIELSRLLLDKRDGDKNQHGGHGRGEHRGPHLPHASQCRLEAAGAATPLQFDTFQHHDTVVQGHTDGERDARQ